MKIPTIKFIYDRRNVSGKNKKGSIELRITYDRKQKFMSTGISVYPRHWNEKTQRIIGAPGAC